MGGCFSVSLLCDQFVNQATNGYVSKRAIFITSRKISLLWSNC
uniref:Uncharacterized protein n=1 Tax=Brassica campestris TaxID=3711 RepID=A0A3P5XWK2_BRACM|nr:unnamed protein product [Brassica rapa]